MPVTAADSYCDAEALSRALQHTNVMAMQINRGAFRAELSKLGVAK